MLPSWSHLASIRPMSAPRTCDTMNAGALLGAIPENVLLSARAAATRHAASLGPVEPMTTRINPAVATASDSHRAGPAPGSPGHDWATTSRGDRLDHTVANERRSSTSLTLWCKVELRMAKHVSNLN